MSSGRTALEVVDSLSHSQTSNTTPLRSTNSRPLLKYAFTIQDVGRSKIHLPDLPVCHSHPKLPLAATDHSSNLDPIFALSIGLAAAATRIRREEKEQGRTDAQTWEALRRRVGSLFSS